MNIEIIGGKVAVITSGELLLPDRTSANDLIGEVAFGYHINHIVLYKESIAEEFFDLSTGFAGEVLQKFVNYRSKLAIVGDFSGYKSKALRDFIVECNRGCDIFYVATLSEAIERLTAV